MPLLSRDETVKQFSTVRELPQIVAAPELKPNLHLFIYPPLRNKHVSFDFQANNNTDHDDAILAKLNVKVDDWDPAWDYHIIQETSKSWNLAMDKCRSEARDHYIADFADSPMLRSTNALTFGCTALSVQICTIIHDFAQCIQ